MDRYIIGFGRVPPELDTVALLAADDKKQARTRDGDAISKWHPSALFRVTHYTRRQVASLLHCDPGDIAMARDCLVSRLGCVPTLGEACVATWQCRLPQ